MLDRAPGRTSRTAPAQIRQPSTQLDLVTTMAKCKTNHAPVSSENGKCTLGDLFTTPPNSPSYSRLGNASTTTESCGPVTPKSTIQLCLKRKAAPGKQIKDAVAVCEFAKSMENAAEENFMVLHLDVRHRVIGVDHMAKGSATGIEVHPREVFKSALLNNASAIILAHNHPSGDPSPSRQDLELTNRLRQIGELHGIEVLDHVVIGANGCNSMAEKGWMGDSGGKYPKPPR